MITLKIRRFGPGDLCFSTSRPFKPICWKRWRHPKANKTHHNKCKNYSVRYNGILSFRIVFVSSRVSFLAKFRASVDSGRSYVSFPRYLCISHARFSSFLVKSKQLVLLFQVYYSGEPTESTEPETVLPLQNAEPGKLLVCRCTVVCWPLAPLCVLMLLSLSPTWVGFFYFHIVHHHPQKDTKKG